MTDKELRIKHQEIKQIAEALNTFKKEGFMLNDFEYGFISALLFNKEKLKEVQI